MSNNLTAGKLIVEIGRTRAAAFAGKQMVDTGADVVTIQDEHRDTQMTPAARLYMDVGKNVVSWTADTNETLIEELIAHADAVVTDLPVDVLQQRGLDWESLHERFPRLSYVSLSSLGWNLTEATPTGELSMQALSGLMHMVGHPDREPLSLPYGMASLQLGLHGAGAISTALFTAEETGRGRLVEISGSDVLASYVRIYGAVANYYSIPLKRDGRRAPGSGGRYPFGFFPCKDGYVAMITRSDREWTSLLEMMGNPEWSKEERYQNIYGIAIEYPDEVDALIAPWLQEHTRDEIQVLAQKYQVPVAAVRSVKEVSEDPQLRDYREFFDTVITTDGQKITVPGRPWASSQRSSDEVQEKTLESILEGMKQPIGK